jgi:hypothetical protein
VGWSLYNYVQARLYESFAKSCRRPRCGILPLHPMRTRACGHRPQRLSRLSHVSPTSLQLHPLLSDHHHCYLLRYLQKCLYSVGRLNSPRKKSIMYVITFSLSQIHQEQSRRSRYSKRKWPLKCGSSFSQSNKNEDFGWKDADLLLTG